MTHDWERIAASEAFFGVLTDDKYRAAELTPERIAEFYATGDADIGAVINTFKTAFGAAPAGAPALDIGCGVGRLARAMRPYATQVTGYDVSDSMLALARKHAGDGVDYVTALPGGPFGWISSFVVFQHIEPPEGLALLKRALATLAPGGFASIQITAWRTAHALPTGLQKLKRAAHFALARAGARPAESLIQMHDYNLSDVIRAFVEAGVVEQHLVHTDHGGHHGVWVFGRRTASGE
jgi:SAM-dependent methyltransferase